MDFARSFLKEVTRDYPAGGSPESDHHFAYRRALRAEGIALEKYNKVLGIYTDLFVNGTIPDENSWLKAQAASACGEGSKKRE